MTKNLHIYDIFFVLNRNFTTKHVENIQDSWFFQVFYSKFKVNPSFLKLLKFQVFYT